jgi:hypothetical protein
MILIRLHGGTKLVKDIGIQGGASKRKNELRLLVWIRRTWDRIKSTRKGDP